MAVDRRFSVYVVEESVGGINWSARDAYVTKKEATHRARAIREMARKYFSEQCLKCRVRRCSPAEAAP